ncbi:hypothetical protein BC938DRAFT_479045 [Jimgerdemannia flammicorona]|uniref:MACPF domain-containing protein n=1 Tax=Jimgerdemannia flammicorona TaxID=994334 RepID=A0A433QLS4_9FUNG|nr:hypothetical protein BC938DRAFT_479045 [Jimgerdemannia flammicorona]
MSEITIAAQLASPQVRLMLFNNLNMNKGITAKGEPALLPCVRPKSDPPEFQVEDCSSNEELTCRSKWIAQTLVLNGFTNESVNAIYHMLPEELSDVYNSKHGISFGSIYYRIEHFSKGLVQLDRKLFEPTKDFERHVRDALAESNSHQDMFGRLKEVWDQFGYAISQKISIGKWEPFVVFFRHQQNQSKEYTGSPSTEYTLKQILSNPLHPSSLPEKLKHKSLGGKLTLWEPFHEIVNDTDRSSFRLAKTNVEAVSKLATGSGFGVNASATQPHSARFSIQQTQGMIIGTFDRDKNWQHTRSGSDQMDGCGNPTSSGFLHGRQIWENSLMRDVNSWKVIKREQIVPIYEFLNDDLRDQVQNVMNAAINLQRIRMDTVFKVCSCNTRNFLAWENFYYGHTRAYEGMVVCTTSLQSETKETLSWNFVAANTSTADSHAQDVYLRYNDIISIRPVTRKKTESSSPMYLYGSQNQKSPLTKTAPECSLQPLKGGKPDKANQWVIEKIDGEAWNAFGSEIDVDATIRRTAYVLKTDKFRLRHRLNDSHYLCSHNQTIEKVDVRLKLNEFGTQKIESINSARQYHEVLLLTRKECGEQKDEWEFQVDSREYGGK